MFPNLAICVLGTCINLTALRNAKIVYNFGLLSAIGLSKHQRDNQKCLLKTDACLIQVHYNAAACFQEMNTCLLNTGCLLNRGGH